MSDRRLDRLSRIAWGMVGVGLTGVVASALYFWRQVGFSGRQHSRPVPIYDTDRRLRP